MTDIVVEVRGGVIVEIYHDDPRMRVVVIDWDSPESSKGADAVGFVWGSCPCLSGLPDDTQVQFQQAVADEVGDEPRIIRT